MLTAIPARSSVPVLPPQTAPALPAHPHCHHPCVGTAPSKAGGGHSEPPVPGTALAPSHAALTVHGAVGAGVPMLRGGHQGHPEPPRAVSAGACPGWQRWGVGGAGGRLRGPDKLGRREFQEPRWAPCPVPKFLCCRHPPAAAAVPGGLLWSRSVALTDVTNVPTHTHVPTHQRAHVSAQRHRGVAVRSQSSFQALSAPPRTQLGSPEAPARVLGVRCPGGPWQSSPEPTCPEQPRALLSPRGASPTITPCLHRRCRLSSPGTAGPSSSVQRSSLLPWGHGTLLGIPAAPARTKAGPWHSVLGALGAWIWLDPSAQSCPPSLLARGDAVPGRSALRCSGGWGGTSLSLSSLSPLEPAPARKPLPALLLPERCAGVTRTPPRVLRVPLTPCEPLGGRVAARVGSGWPGDTGALRLPGCSAFPGR